MSRSERPTPWPYRQGAVWLSASFSLLAAQPVRLLVIGLLLQLLVGLSQAGFLGLLFMLVLPALSAGVLQAMHLTRQGQRPSLGTLFAAFANPQALGRLVLLGALIVACAVGAVAFGLAGSLATLDPAVLAQLEAGDAEALAQLDPAMLQGAVLALGLGMLVGGSLAFYAVPLIWFSGLGLWRAIADGFLGMIREWRALLVLGVLVGLMSFPIGVLVASHLIAGGEASMLLTLLTLLATVVFQLLLFAAQYLSWADIFGAPPAERQPPAEGQLVA